MTSLRSSLLLLLFIPFTSIGQQVVKKSGYQLTIPNYMTSTDDLNDEASLQYENIDLETYVIVIDESKQEFIDVFKEEGWYDNDKSVIDNYTDVQVESFKSFVTAFKKLKPKSAEIGGCPAYFLEVEGRAEGIDYDIYYSLAFVEGKNSLYLVMSWTLLEYKKKYKKVFREMLESFKEI